MESMFQDVFPFFPFAGIFGFIVLVVVTLVAWSLIWKGIALYYAARNEHKGWFIAILILNTMGVLPIVYLLLFAKPKEKNNSNLKSQISKPQRLPVGKAGKT